MSSEIEIADQHVVNVMNKWSGAFSKILLPSSLGTKSQITRVADEGAKVVSVAVFMAQREGEVVSIPYDGSTYEGHTMKDESEGTLWAYEVSFPGGYAPQSGKDFIVSLGHVFKCHNCRGQGRVTCRACRGRVRWTKKNLMNDGYTNYTCTCGDGKQDCPVCTGYGELLKALKVTTKYYLDENKQKDYSGKLPESLLLGSPGDTIFSHEIEFSHAIIAEAIDGFDSEEFTRLMDNAQAELKQEVSNKVSGQMTDRQVLPDLIDDYFKKLPNPVMDGKRLESEVVPIRMRCSVTNVPMRAVDYHYKGTAYSLYIYGGNDAVWTDGKKPSEFTWKAGVGIGVIITLILLALLAG